MRNNTSARLLSAALVLFAAMTSGCGDYPSGSSAESGDIVPRNTPLGLQGRTVYLRRHSTRCGSPASTPLSAEVGNRVEFPADRTQKLDSPCPEAPNPGIEISVDGRSLIFDFSNLDEAGVFPQAEFEGYELAFARRCGDPVIASAAVDAEQSAAGTSSLEVSHHYDRIRVNFERLAYDRSSFVKVDLELAHVGCIGDEGAASSLQPSAPH